MGSFDDLIPAKGNSAKQGTFDDLIPKKKPASRHAGQYGITPYLIDTLDAAQHNAMNVLHGGAQLVTHGLSNLPVVGDYFADVAQKDDAALRQREADYQARTQDNPSSYLGAGAGQLLPWVAGAGALRAQGLLPVANSTAAKAGLLATEGALMGATTPVTEQGDYGAQKGSQVAVGAAAAPLLAAGLKGTSAGLGATSRASRYLTGRGREAIANERVAAMLGPDALPALRAGSGVDGFVPTPAQAIGTPGAVQAERALRNNPMAAAAFAERESANNEALRNAVARLAGTDEQMAAAEAARRNGPGQFWRDNLSLGAEDGRFTRAGKILGDYARSKTMPRAEFNVLDEGRRIAGQVQRGTISAAEGEAAINALKPSTKGGKKALDQAIATMNNGMVNPNRIVAELERLGRSGNRAVSSAAGEHLATIAKNQDDTGWIHARVLDDIRQNIGSMLKQHQGGSKEGALYGPLSAKIVNQIDRAVPGYRDSLAAYARLSQPISDMQAARTVLGAIDSGARDAGGNQAVSLTQIKAALAKDAKARYPMSREARKQLEAVRDALQQRSITNNTVAASGPGTAADVMRGGMPGWMQRFGGQLAGGVGAGVGGLPGYLLATGAAEAAMAARNSVQRKVGKKASDSLLAAEAIEAARRDQSNRGLLDRYLLPEYLLPYVQD